MRSDVAKWKKVPIVVFYHILLRATHIHLATASVKPLDGEGGVTLITTSSADYPLWYSDRRLTRPKTKVNLFSLSFEYTCLCKSLICQPQHVSENGIGIDARWKTDCVEFPSDITLNKAQIVEKAKMAARPKCAVKVICVEFLFARRVVNTFEDI